MPIQLQGSSGVLAEVDGTTYRAWRATLRPLDPGAGGHYSLSMASGTMAVSLGAGAEIFQWRYVTAAARVAVVYYCAISAGPNVAATTAVLQAFLMTAARSWTVAGSGGSRAVLTGNNAKLRTSYSTSEVSDSGISTTAALTTGTKTLDVQNIGSVAFGVGTGAITTATNLLLVPKTTLFNPTQQGCHPLVCANQEGFVVRLGGIAGMPAGMTWTFSVDVRWAEVPTF